MNSQADERVDDLRRQLRSLGYLDAGVDRFVLGPARERRGPSALAAQAALRVGLLGGVLLGPAAAIGVGARLPGLVSGVRDAAVVAVYLAIVFFLAIAALSFAISVTIAAVARTRGDRFTRRASVASRASGWVVSGACLVYLTLWWRNAAAGFGWSAPGWTAFALVVAVAISLLLGHAQRIATIAVLATAVGPNAALPPAGVRSWRVVLGAGALAFAGAAGLLVSTASVQTPPGSGHPPLTVISRGRAIRVIAIDGFDPAMYDTFAPDLATRVAGRRVRLQSQDTSDPARAWTTIATGQPPEIHGVHAIETRRVAGLRGRLSAGGGAVAAAVGAATDLLQLTRPSVASRDERRSKTIWEVADEAGLRTAVVNWWATWPASPGSGVVVTDRAMLRLEQGGTLDGEIGPASLYAPLRAAWPGIRDRARAFAVQYDPSPDAAIDVVLRRSAELDATIVGLVKALPGPARDLDVVYLPGLDIAQHALLASPEGAAPTPSAMAARIDGLRGYYAVLRILAGDLLQPDRGTDVVVVTQPGRVQARADGILAAYEAPGRSGDVRPGLADQGSGRVADIAPTLINALGIPLSRELAGTPLQTVMSNSVRYVDTYGRPSNIPTVREGKPLDQEMIDRLRSLGYVK